MEFIKPSIKIDFVGARKGFTYASITLVSLSLILVMAKGLTYGIDFAGGTEVQVKFNDSSIEAGKLRDILKDAGFPRSVVQTFGDDGNEYLLRVDATSTVSDEQSEALQKDFEATFGEGSVKSFEFIPDSDKIEVHFAKEVERTKIEERLKSAGIEGSVSSGGSSSADYTILPRGVSDVIKAKLTDVLGEGTFEVRRVDFVGPAVGEALRQDGVTAVLYALIAILIYIAFRFDFMFAPGAIAALVHDVLITLGIFSLFELEVSLTFVAAMLTIVGYSLNDTIVVFDRIRENTLKFKSRSVDHVVNVSLNETLSRTVLTSLTTLFVVLMLLVLGGGIIRLFSVALLIGIIVGTYSSIFVASSTYIWLRHKFDAGAPTTRRSAAARA